MTNYKSNSERKPLAANPEKSPEKKFEKVISGTAKIKKKSAFRRMYESFIVKDVGDINEYVFMDVMLPAVKNTILDVLSMLFFGNSRGGRGPVLGSRAPYVSYENKYSNKPTVNSAVQVRAGFAYEDILFATLSDAKDVYDRASEALEMYNILSVFDLYDMAGIRENDFTNNKYGWSTIVGADIVQTRGGYLLKMPRPMPITMV